MTFKQRFFFLDTKQKVEVRGLVFTLHDAIASNVKYLHS